MKNLKNNLKQNLKKAFTLVELIVVIAILAALTALALPSLSGIIKTAKCRVDLNNAHVIYNNVQAIIHYDSVARAGLYTFGKDYNVTSVYKGKKESYKIDGVCYLAGFNDEHSNWHNMSRSFNGNAPAKKFIEALNNEMNLHEDSKTDKNAGVQFALQYKGSKDGRPIERWYVCKRYNNGDANRKATGRVEIWVGQGDPQVALYRLYPEPDDYYTS